MKKNNRNFTKNKFIFCTILSFTFITSNSYAMDPVDDPNTEILKKSISKILPAESSKASTEVDENKSDISYSLEKAKKNLQEEFKKENLDILRPYLKKEEDSIVNEHAEGATYYVPASLLSIDGGGIRGYMPALWLDYISQKSNREIHELFDFMGGTSIGGILALGVAAPKEADLSTKALVGLFEHEADYIFPKKAKTWVPQFVYDKLTYFQHKYSEKPLEGLLTKYFGDRVFGDVRGRVIVTSVIQSDNRPFLFKSYQENLLSCPIWEVARATSAAPTYFKAHSILFPNEDTKRTFFDGGLYANNPVRDIITEAFLTSISQGKKLSHKNIHVISLGTGKSPVEHIPEAGGKIRIVSPLISAMMTSSSEGAHDAVETLLTNKRYLRINPDLERNIELDEASSSNMEYMKQIAEEQYSLLDKSIDTGVIRRILEARDKDIYLFPKKQ